GDVVTGKVTTNQGAADAALTPGHSYSFWVQAQTTKGAKSAWGGPMSFTIQPLDTPTPQTPTGSLTVLTSSDLTPSFTWTTVTGADSYEIWVNDNGNKLYDVTVKGNGTSAWSPPAPLAFGHSLVWWVRALDSEDGNASDWSTAVSFQLELDVPRLMSPSGDSSSTSSTFQWNAVVGADSY